MTQSVLVTGGEGTCAVHMQAILCGADLNVSVTGGSKPHVGTCVLAVPRASLKNASKRSATVSVLNVQSHKDDVVATKVAHTLAAHFNCVVCLSAGLHIDNAGENDIALLLKNTEHAQQKLIQQLELIKYDNPDT